MKKIIFTEKALEKLAETVIELILEKKYNHATVLALQGDLGSGKTTFTKKLAKNLGITECITSPTFVIQKVFDVKSETFKKTNQKIIWEKFIHIDSYRLDLAKELENLGWHDFLNDTKNIIVVEWPERILEILPKEYFLIKFKHRNETSREVEIMFVKTP
jgi:tRNA threonylcarbamoyladenosine biosynthesis protein TsaE